MGGVTNEKRKKIIEYYEKKSMMNQARKNKMWEKQAKTSKKFVKILRKTIIQDLLYIKKV